MTIAVDWPRLKWWLVGLGLALLIAATWLGYIYTPTPARLFTPSDWTTLKVEQVYQAEREQLRVSVTELAQVLQSTPDPVRVGLLHDHVVQVHQAGLPLLAEQRALVITAAEGVYGWASGANSYEAAVTVVEAAIESLK
jgi:hypothetical protein